ncbi:hypothetical protein QH494_16000 [Sphingomonas sp. AR_OL41]|uniref:hypothetical protein n=1 Tax=Sphingomonas sp. AR_OL41 TaxID=3042729 RepID=UPI00247FD9FA|nr:hypothetical protein [Sphingomonas sp. AR_OL41]MDH7973695.1 hypothetical protein [Sphingomonas sp. AR_OL41]
MPKAPEQKPLPERQALQLPDGGSAAGRVDDDIRRRRALMATAYTGQAGLGTAPNTTSVLGG